MNIIEMKIGDIIPYHKNAKIHDSIQVDNVAESIRRFGFVQPLVVDKDNNLIIGHGRLKASQKLGLKVVPVVRMDDLTEEQVKQLRILDNKLNESEWDFELLAAEIEELDFDGFDIDFNLPEESEEQEEDLGYYGDERERTNNAYNMNLQGEVDFTDDFWQMPIIHKETFVPKDLIGFNYALSSQNKDVGIHCYVDDYQFERLWNSPDDYIEKLAEYQCFLSPDFSLYMDMMMPTKIYNIYRSRLIGAYYQARGIKVIPTVSWAEPETYKFCFAGIEKGGVVSVSTIGVKEDPQALKVWQDGMAEMIKQIKPKTILVYGGKLDFDYGKINVVYFTNHVTDNWREKSNDTI